MATSAEMIISELRENMLYFNLLFFFFFLFFSIEFYFSFTGSW